jgi:hypothetical protein
MNLVHILKRAEKLAVDNSPTILTAFGIAGVVSTAVLTGKASIKADKLIRHEESLRQRFYNPREQAALVWKLYIPAVSSGLLTIAAIVGSNHVSTRRATAMAAVYSISEKAFVEYKDKVVERLGEKKEQSFRDEIAQDRVKNNPVNENTVIITDGGEVLCYDHFTGRYFKSSMEAIKKAQNDINYQILHDGYASVSDLFDILGLPVTSYSEEVGWNQDRMLDIAFSTVLSEDNRPCISIDFDLSPNRKFSHFADED